MAVNDEDLPASFRSRQQALALPFHNFDEYLDDDLSVDKIEQVHPHLWLVGRPTPPRPLNIQVVLNRSIIATTDASLHLVWSPGRIYVKPLPQFFFSAHFYAQYVHGTNVHGSALGLLFTYVALVPTELDFELAKEHHLLSDGVQWRDWKALSRRFIEDYPDRKVYSVASLPKRYKYGELRFGRLNKIYRYLKGDLLHGFSTLTGTPTYAQFFSNNVAAVTSVTVYIVVVLTALQVGLATPDLLHEATFQRVCYGFTIFAIVSPMAALLMIALVFLFIFVVNWWRTWRAQRQLQRSGNLQSEEEKSFENSGETAMTRVVPRI